jgi:hypothetical protein
MEGIKKLEIFPWGRRGLFCVLKCVTKNIRSHILVVEEKLVL